MYFLLARQQWRRCDCSASSARADCICTPSASFFFPFFFLGGCRQENEWKWNEFSSFRLVCIDNGMERLCSAGGAISTFFFFFFFFMEMYGRSGVKANNGRNHHNQSMALGWQKWTCVWLPLAPWKKNDKTVVASQHKKMSTIKQMFSRPLTFC